MILVTGHEGFVGSHVMSMLDEAKMQMCVSQGTMDLVNTKEFFEEHGKEITAIFHLAAVSDTTCEDEDLLSKTNVALPALLAVLAEHHDIPFIYASSAGVYGNGEGPLTAYARSKLTFDEFMLNMKHGPRYWYGLRLFNVYGPGEEKKDEQASMVSKAMRGKTDYYDLSARRDFVYVRDVVEIMLWLMLNIPQRGIYDVGTGRSRSIREMCEIVGIEPHETGVPPDRVGKLQTNTIANINGPDGLREVGYESEFWDLEQGVEDMRHGR